MTNDTHRSQLSLVAVIGFIVLGAWLFLLRVAGDWQLISPFTENMLAFVSGVGMLSAVALRFGRGGTSQTIRVTFFLLIMSASAELFLNFSSHVSAWDQLPVIGRQSSARPILEHLLFCCWAGGAFMLIYLLLRAAENTNKKLQASERWFRTIFESEPECVKLLDREGNLLDMNSAGLNLIEADSLDQVRGQCIYSVVAEEHRARFIAGNEAVFDGNSSELEFEIIGLRQTRRWMESHNVPLRDSAGNITASLSVTRDITDRKTSEERLSQSEQRFRSIFEQAGVAVGLIDSQTGKFIRVNDKYTKLIGYSRDELIGKTWMDVTFADDMQADLRQMERMLAAEINDFTIEKRLMCKDGSIIWVNLTVSAMWNQPADLRQHIVIVEDITERKLAEQALRQSEQRLRVIMEQMPAILWTTDRELRFTFGTGAGLEAVGVEQGQLTGVSLYDYFGQKDPDFLPIRMHHQAMAGSSESYKTQWKDVVFHNYVEPLRDPSGTIIGVIGVALDVTELTRVEDSLRESERTYRTLFDGSPVGIGIVDEDGNLVDVNEELVRILAYTQKDEIANQNVSRFFDNSDDQRRIARKANSQEFTGEEEVVLRRKGGTEFHALVGLAPVTIEGNQRTLTTVQDITRRRKLEIELQRFRDILDHAGEAIFVIDPANAQFIDLNTTVIRCLGYSRAELLRLKAHDVLVMEREIGLHDWDDFVESIKSNGVRVIEGVQRRKDDSTFPVEVAISYRTLDEREYVLAISRDITERKVAQKVLQDSEERSRQHQKLLAHANRVATVGELAAGLAHELNQPLAAICMLSKACITKLESSSCSAEGIVPILSNLEEQSLRAGSIVDRIRRFVGNEEFSRTECRVETLFDDVLELLDAELVEQGIAIDVQVPDANLEVLADRVQVEQVLINLIHNSIDAINEDASSIRRLELKARSSNDGFVEMAVRDFGPGMTEDIAANVFDAFYSTKSKGMGMGLAICRTIVEAHGGRIDLAHNPQEGVTCKIKLPGGDVESVEKTRD